MFSYQRLIFASQADDWTGGDVIMDQMGQWDKDLHEKWKYEELEVKIASYMSGIKSLEQWSFIYLWSFI